MPLTNREWMQIGLQLILPLVLALLFFPALPISTRATTLARLSLDQLTAGSAAVARVRCARAESRWENGSIWTLTTLEVVETMKGNLPAEIAVRLPGGRVGHISTAVEGAPKFIPGSEAVLFLQPSSAGGLTVAGWAEGTFRITRDPRTAAETVTQDSSAFAVFDVSTRKFRAEGIRHMPIGEFRARVAAAILRSQVKTR